MPYIITTTRPCGAQFNRCREPSHERAARRAVATLEEAREAIAAPILAASPEHVWHLAEQGGTIGPLPDGTVIEVQRVLWRDLVDVTHGADLRDFKHLSEADILDAYSASAVIA